jgi:hypothetical protein
LGTNGDHYIGRKFESGASKKKKDVLLQKKNKELTVSLFKSLIRNEDACFNNRGFGDDAISQLSRLDMILPKDEVSRTKEDANFSGIKTYICEKGLSSIVTKENSETELSSTISCDPGEWTVPLSDSR